MKKSIAYITSGLQLLNLVEAIHYHQCTENYVIIGHNSVFPERIRQLKKFLHDPFIKKNFKKIFYLPARADSKSPFRFVEYVLGSVELFFIFLFIRKIDFLFLSLYTFLYQRQSTFLASSFNKKVELWSIDEGCSIIEIVNQRNKLLSEDFFETQKKRNWIVGYYNRIRGKNSQPLQLHFFSAFDLQVKGKDVYIKNTMSYWKENNPYAYKFHENAVVFIGHPLVDSNFVTEESYKNYLTKMFHDAAHHKIYYFPHPIETRYNEFLPDGIEIVKTPLPAELLLLGSNIKSIIGFDSTVLYNAAALNICHDITSYWINSSDYLRTPNMEARNNLKKTFEEINIKIILL